MVNLSMSFHSEPWITNFERLYLQAHNIMELERVFEHIFVLNELQYVVRTMRDLAPTGVKGLAPTGVRYRQPCQL